MAAPTFWGPQFLINTTTKNGQRFPSLTALKDGSFLAVWEDSSYATGDNSSEGIVGQIFNADGSKRGGEFLINTATADGQVDATVTVLNDGRFVVAWQDVGTQVGSLGYAIKARVYRPDGTPAGGEFQVNTTGAHLFGEPSVKALSNGGFAVAYTNADRSIKVQSFDAAMQRMGGEVAIGTPGESSDATVVALEGQYAVFYWGASGKVHGRILNNDGSVPSGSADFVISGADKTSVPAATTLANGRIVVTWRDVDQNCLKAQFLNADGSKHGSAFKVSTDGAGDSFQPVITSLADGGFAIAYLHGGLREVAALSEVRLATFTSEGAKAGEDIVIASGLNDPHLTAITTTADGRVVVSWGADNGILDPDWVGVYAQIVDPRQQAVKLSGSSFNDEYFGTGFHDTMGGANGADTLHGGDGDDRLYGGRGNDTLMGEAGQDNFVFDTKLGTHKTDRAVNFDKIADFKVKDDSIWLDNAIFKKLGKKGSEFKPAKLKKSYFEVGTKAKDKNDYIVYNKKTGVLSYDADGSGRKKAIEIAQLDKKLKMTYKDFFVI